MHLAPGSPAILMLGIDASQEAVLALEEELGLDQPFFSQYARWLSRIGRGNFGNSILLKTPVLQELILRTPVTFSLGVGSLLLAIIIGIPAAIIAAKRPNGWRDTTIMGFCMIGVSTPEFLLGLLLIFFIGVKLRWLPVAGYVSLRESFAGWLAHLVMPWFSLGAIHAALIARMTRATVLESLHSDYVRTARAKGVAEYRVLFLHAFRNALVPVVSVIGVSAVIMIGGAFITEVLFGLPGIGRLVISAVQHRDYPVVQGGMVFIATVVLLFNLGVDVSYTFLDPRIHYE